jgi:hypothetical protein
MVGSPYDYEVERWLCNPRVSGSNPGAGNLEKVVYLDEKFMDSHKNIIKTSG